MSPASEPSGSIATLRGKRGLVVGIANRESIAWGCALACRRAGAEIAVTALNEKAEAHVRPLADEIGSPLLLPLDVTVAGQAEAAFESVRRLWGGLDFLVHAIAFDVSGRYLMALTNDGAVNFWEIETGRHHPEFQAHHEGATALAAQPDNGLFATGSIDGGVAVWRREQGESRLVRMLRGHEQPVVALAFGLQGVRMTTAGVDGLVKIWDIETGQEALTLSASNDAITATEFQSDRRRVHRLVVAAKDGFITIWDAPPTE